MSRAGVSSLHPRGHTVTTQVCVSEFLVEPPQQALASGKHQPGVGNRKRPGVRALTPGVLGVWPATTLPGCPQGDGPWGLGGWLGARWAQGLAGSPGGCGYAWPLSMGPCAPQGPLALPTWQGGHVHAGKSWLQLAAAVATHGPSARDRHASWGLRAPRLGGRPWARPPLHPASCPDGEGSTHWPCG